MPTAPSTLAIGRRALTGSSSAPRTPTKRKQEIPSQQASSPCPKRAKVNTGTFKVFDWKGETKSADGGRATYTSLTIAPSLGGILIEVGKFMCAVIKKQKGAPGDCIGKVCEMYSEENGEYHVKLQRYARQLDMVQTRAKMLEVNEIVETSEFLSLPASSFREEVSILSAEAFQADGAEKKAANAIQQTFFCARALCPDGSQVLWPIDWSDDSREKVAAVADQPAQVQQTLDKSRCPNTMAAWLTLKGDELRTQCMYNNLPCTPRFSKSDLAQRLMSAGVSLPGSVQKVASITASTASTPSVPEGNALLPPSNKFERVAAAFRPGAPATRLFCRDDERKEIYSHLKTAVRQGGCKQVFYMSGMPGTGKTASLLEAVDRMAKDAAIPDFTFVHINAMCLGVQHAVFSEIHRKVSQQAPPGTNPFGRPVGGLRTVGAANAHAELTTLFSNPNPNDRVIFLLIDEIDQLVTANQAVLYRLFDWLTLPNARLVISAISNTVDLPERLLPRVASRLGVVRVDFKPYDRGEIHHILRERIKACNGSGVFADDALRLCAARIAAGSGDIRKALQLCRRAIEMRSEGDQVDALIGVQHLRAAEKDLLHANPAAQSIARLSLKARRFLLAVVIELRKHNADNIPWRKAAGRYESVMARREAYLSQEKPQAHDEASLSQENVEFMPGLLDCVRPIDEAYVLADRLTAMSLLVWRSDRHLRAEEEGMLSLGDNLDLDEMANTLAEVNGDDDARELLRA